MRLHDTEYLNGQAAFIDIHCIFPEMTKDPDDLDVYRFTEMDAYINNTLDARAQVYYRLGESIDMSGGEKSHQQPPEKWADICAHIIANHNAGWNNGFDYNIRYWHI